MVRVCSSRRDQHFWLLDHSISSSYEKVMIKIRKRKVEEFCRNVLESVLQDLTLEGRRRAFKGKPRREN